MAITRYQLKTEKAPLPTRIRLLYVSHSKYEDDWPSHTHTHPFTELFFIKSGSGSILVEDREYRVHTDDLVIINANIVHTEKSTGKESLEYIALGAEGVSFAFRGEENHLIFNCQGKGRDISFYFNSLLRETEEEKPGYDLVCQNLLEVLLIQLGRWQDFSITARPSVKSSRECYKLKRYLEANYPLDITLDSLAELSHLNKYYLTHTFTKHFGCSPMTYLCGIRIKASKELLESTDYSIAEIASHTGFSSQSYFAQVFMKNCHMSASEYRKAFRKT